MTQTKNNYPTLLKLATKQIQEQYKKKRTDIKTPEGLAHALKWERKTYKKNEREQLSKYFARKEATEIKKVENELLAISNAPNFADDFIITVEWRDSRMWRSNPRAYTNKGFIGDSIGGCGYDKQSTATAQALNSHLPIIKLLCAKKEQALKNGAKEQHDNRNILGYGAGYNVIPQFEGGVGVESHKQIIEGVGLCWENMTNSPNTDVYIIKKTTTKQQKK